MGGATLTGDERGSRGAVGTERTVVAGSIGPPERFVSSSLEEGG